MIIEAPNYPTTPPAVAAARAAAAMVPGTAQSHMAELDRLLAVHDNNALVQAAMNPTDSAMLPVTLDWGQARMLAGGPLPVTLIYARALWQIGSLVQARESYKETATFVTLYALLTSLSDGTKCADPTAVDNRFRTILNGYQEQIRYIAQLPPESAKRATMLALQMESTLAPKRGNDNYLCRGGLQEMQDYIQTHDTTKLPRETGPGIVGSNVTIPYDPAYEPKYRTRDEWEPKQQQLRQTFAALLDKIAPGNNR
jgi:hypothetical protein